MACDVCLDMLGGVVREKGPGGLLERRLALSGALPLGQDSWADCTA